MRRRGALPLPQAHDIEKAAGGRGPRPLPSGSPGSRSNSARPFRPATTALALNSPAASGSDTSFSSATCAGPADAVPRGCVSPEPRKDRLLLALLPLLLREKALGPDHLHVAWSLNGLADLYLKQGQYAQAEPLYKRSLAIREKAFGPDHPDVAQSLESLAKLYRATDRAKEAEVLEKRAAAIRAIKR